MLENKIEELKVERQLSSDNEKSLKRINTSIDLNVDAYIPEEFFTSDLDKINFYREIESIRELDDLNNLITDFKEINPNIPESTENLFNLIKIKILSSEYKINSLRKV
jgi:transcription-repair coupling factor (superfamily II helicase)